MTSLADRSDLYRALRRGRIAVDRHASKMAHADHMWAEETATDLLLGEVWPHARFRKFTRWQERHVGADWLWWWVDSTGESFGMLVQAKNLKRSSTRRWHIDFDYTPEGATQSQLTILLMTADLFGVPAAHVLYCGNPTYRKSLNCTFWHEKHRDCRSRARAGVSVVPSIIPKYLKPFEPTDRAAQAFHWSLPLEDFADPARDQGRLRPLGRVHPDIKEFMLEPQAGARRIAKMMLESLTAMRIGQTSLAQPANMVHSSDLVFDQLPMDTGHFGLPYVAHVLWGLRREPPPYLEDLLTGDLPEPWMDESIAGIAVIEATGDGMR
ncbi:hypothetical protein [Nocardia brasiliensis]|uniref:hypothetical protein n=1 Tax=Nocardia brasiliensis TaxID=37326 RepID=UPI002458FCD7|nr:hypothetical protein [Nocardia brasiliensis]